MTNRIAAAAVARTFTPAATPAAPVEASKDGETRILGMKPLMALGVAAAVGAAALGGRALYLHVQDLKAPAFSGAIDGVNLLANPRLPRGIKPSTWGSPTGTLFGPVDAATGRGKVLIDHVDQGQLGDCWFVAGEGAIADTTPKVFEDMLIEHPNGIMVRLPAGPTPISKDLPLRRDGTPLFAGSGPKDPVLWPAYVEKAVAARNSDGYRGLESGWARETFELLLGTKAPMIAKPAGMMDDMAARLKNGQAVTLGSTNESVASAAQLAALERNGAHTNHMYVVRDVIPAKEGQEAQAVLFNPWGGEHPKPMNESDITLGFVGMDATDASYRWNASG